MQPLVKEHHVSCFAACPFFAAHPLSLREFKVWLLCCCSQKWQEMPVLLCLMQAKMQEPLKSLVGLPVDVDWLASSLPSQLRPPGL